MVERMILIGEGRSTWKGNKTNINPARNGKFLGIMLTKKKRERERGILKSNFIPFL